MALRGELQDGSEFQGSVAGEDDGKSRTSFNGEPLNAGHVAPWTRSGYQTACVCPASAGLVWVARHRCGCGQRVHCGRIAYMWATVCDPPWGFGSPVRRMDVHPFSGPCLGDEPKQFDECRMASSWSTRSLGEW